MTIILAFTTIALAALCLALLAQLRVERAAVTDAYAETEDVRRHYETSANNLRGAVAAAEDERDAARAHIAAIHRTNALLPLAPHPGGALRADLGAEATDWLAMTSAEFNAPPVTPIRPARKKAGKA